MRKRFASILLGIVATGTIMGFSACANDKKAEDTYYTVTFVMPGGTSETRKVKAGESLTDLPALHIEGYTAVWEGNFTDIQSDLTITKYKATANEYTVTYTTDENVTLQEGTEKTLTVTYDAAYTLATPTLPEGKYFWYWYYGENQTPVNTQGDAWKIAQDITLTARYDDRVQDAYMVKFIGLNGTEPIIKWVKNGADYAEEMPALPEVAGYTAAWNKSADELKNITADTEVALVLTPKTYTVTLDLNLKGASVESTSLTATYKAVLTLPTPTAPSASEKVFVGWKVKDTEKTFISGAIYEYTADITLVAQWKGEEWTKFY